MNEVHYLTPDGHKRLLQEQEEIKSKRIVNTKRIEEAIKMGDLSENAEYTDAKEEQAFLEGRLAEIEEILKNIEIIKKTNDHETVSIGSTITIKNSIGSKIFTIVGPQEADPPAGLISHESPLGKSFLGAKVGQTIAVSTPRGEIKYKIVSVE